MGKLQRTRGAAYEREVCDVLTKKFGTKVSRKLGQARDGGDDIEVGNFKIECKRRRGIAVYAWLDQVNAAAKDCDKLPLVVARADNRRSIVILDLEDFLALIPDDDGNPKDPLAGRQVASPKPPASLVARSRSRANKVERVVEDLRKEPGFLAGAGAGNDERLQCQSSLGAKTAAMGGLGRLRVSALVPKAGKSVVARVRGEDGSSQHIELPVG